MKRFWLRLPLRDLPKQLRLTFYVSSEVELPMHVAIAIEVLGSGARSQIATDQPDFTTSFKLMPPY